MGEPRDAINAGAEAPNTAPGLEVTSEEEQKKLDDAESNQPQVPTSDGTKKDLLHKYNRLEDEIALLRVDIDRVRCHSQDMEKKYLENIEIVKAKGDDLQRTIKVYEETERETTFQRSEQLNDLKAEITTLTFELEKLKQSKASLEAELEPYCAGLDLAPPHPYESQTPERNLESSLQQTNDEYFNSQAKMDFDTCNLKVNSEIVSQQLSKNKIKICSLENHDSCQGQGESLSQRENLVVPTPYPQPARKSIEDHRAKMEKAADKSLTRALEEVTTEFEPGPTRTTTPKSTDNSSQDIRLEA